MARWSGSRLALCVASASVVAGCFLGGQTGQPGEEAPTSGCDTSGVSPDALARAFEGQHSAALSWLRASPDAGPPVTDDEITIDVVDAGLAGTTCPLSVPVTVTITTRDTGIHETGTGTLFSSGVLDFVRLEFSGQRVNVTVFLQRSNGMIELSGSLRSLDSSLPGPSATFQIRATATGTGGSPGAP